MYEKVISFNVGSRIGFFGERIAGVDFGSYLADYRSNRDLHNIVERHPQSDLLRYGYSPQQRIMSFVKLDDYCN
jgi:hypothetical protein